MMMLLARVQKEELRPGLFPVRHLRGKVANERARAAVSEKEREEGIHKKKRKAEREKERECV